MAIAVHGWPTSSASASYLSCLPTTVGCKPNALVQPSRAPKDGLDWAKD